MNSKSNVLLFLSFAGKFGMEIELEPYLQSSSVLNVSTPPDALLQEISYNLCNIMIVKNAMILVITVEPH